MNFLKTDKAPEAIGPYSQGVSNGSVLFTSGQLPVDMETGEIVSGDIKKATRAALSNVLAIVEAGGGKKENIAKVLVFVRDMNDFQNINEEYADFFGEHKPARSLVEVSNLPKNVEIEIEAVAFI